MNKKVIILNCPPRSGKDTIADLYVARHKNCTKKSFKDRLFQIAFLVSNVSQQEWFERYETMKDVPWDRLGGLSQRNYLIKISEDWVKPVHGQEYFGQKLLEDVIEDNDHDTFIIPDGGFEDEVKPLANYIDNNNILILQWSRKGSSFDNDSRDWVITYPNITVKIDDNNNSIEAHYTKVRAAIKGYFNDTD